MGEAWAGISRDRVVAVVATLTGHREQFGSGYLVGGRLALTAEHCTRDKLGEGTVVRLRVIRASDGSSANVVETVGSSTIDVAVLRLADTAPWTSNLDSPAYARVNREKSGRLLDCEAVGYPLMQRDPIKKTRDTAELHGTIYQTDLAESGRLLMRDPTIHPGDVLDSSNADQATDGTPDNPSPWGGFSGALVFYRGRAIGVVVEHHPRQGDSALQAMPFDTIVKKATTDASTQCVADTIGLPTEEMLPWATATSSSVSALPFAMSKHSAVSRVVDRIEITGPPPNCPFDRNDVGTWLVKLADWSDDASSLISEIEEVAHFINNDLTARFIQAIDDSRESVQGILNRLADDKVARRDADSLKSAADDLWDRIMQLVPLSMKQ